MQGYSCSFVIALPQRLAVDVSIWLTRFIKAMRDEDGRMRTNAHILGVLRRLCKVRRSVLFACKEDAVTT